MLSRRPLLYLTIPSLALLIGLWFRRKKALAAARSRGGSKDPTANSVDATSNSAAPLRVDLSGLNQTSATDRVRARRDISESVPIGSGSDDDLSLLNTSNCSSTNSHKSLGQRSPPIPIANRASGHTSDELSLEDSDIGSPDDLDDSYERRNFEMVKNSLRANRSADVPIKVITASKSPKISPKNAFSEANGTSTPAKKAQPQQKQQQQQPPKTEQQEDSLIIQSPMAKLSLLDDSGKQQSQQQQKKNKKGNAAAVDPPKATEPVLQAKNATNSSTSNATNSAENGAAEDAPQPPTATSPSLSLYSNDSGKGASPTQSEAATAAGEDHKSAATAAAAAAAASASCYEFLVHEKYVGLLIGREGMTVKKLLKRFGVHMIVRSVPNCPRTTDCVCAIMGAPAQIKAAVQFLRQRMPLDRYPDLTMERVYFASSPSDDEEETTAGSVGKKPVMPIHYPVAQLPISLSLVEGINNDVVISSILNGGHIFVQQQSHPTYHQLSGLHATMSQHYSAGDSPVLDPVAVDSVCVAPVNGLWCRMVIASVDEVQQVCVAKFLDFGGFVTVPLADLRQIRTDFMALPFQSIECVLSNLSPVGGEWQPAAADLVTQLSSGRILQAQVAGYTAEGIPEVLLFAPLGPDNIAFINQELVAQGYAEWVADEEEVEEILAQ